MGATMEKRIRTLERELAALKASCNETGCNEKNTSYYEIAVEKCESHYQRVAGALRSRTPYNSCMEMARSAFKDKRGISYQGIKPNEYIKTLSDAEELFGIFKRFLTQYLQYLAESRVSEW